MSKVLLIDGNSILNRAFYAIPLLTNSEGLYTNAIYGFMNILLKLLDEDKPEYIGVAFDLKAPTFRHKHYSEYKGNRKTMPDELRVQMPVIKELLCKMNISTFEMEGYEADDILGTLAKRYEKNGMDVSLVSGDRDMLQVATDMIKIRIPKTIKGKTETEDYYAKDVLEKYQVTPIEFIDLKALMGDSSDNIPGVPGIGEKTATKIISEYKSIENAIEKLDQITPKGVAEKIRNNTKLAIMSKFLATICLDVPVTNEACKISDMLNDESINMLKKLEFRSVIEKLSKGKLQVVGEIKKDEKTSVVTIIDSEAVFEKLTSKLQKQKQFAFKILEENGQILGIAACFKNDECYLVKQNNGFDIQQMLNIFSGLLEDDSVIKIGHDIKRDMKILKSYGFGKINNFEDLMVAHYLLNPTREKYDYNDIASEFLKEYLDSREEVFGKGKSKKSIFEVDELTLNKYISDYMTTLINAIEVIKQKIGNDIQKELLYTIEYPLVEVLADMEFSGIKINREYLSEYSNKINKMVDTLEETIYNHAGTKFNINSPKQMGEILFERLGLPVGKKTKTGYSTNVDVLEKLKHQHEIVWNIIEYRHLSKLKTTYADGLVDYIDKKTDKIHTTFNQTVTATGRLSSTDPNLQNIPIRLEIGKEIRKIFVPSSEEYVFIDADYSQIELRLLAHISSDETLINAYKNNQDIHRLTASQVLGIPFDEVTKEQRSSAKAVNFGIVYGISAFSLSQDINVSPKEAEKYIKGYFDKYPRVKEYLKEVVIKAKEDGYVETIFGRRREIPELNASNFMQRAFGERVAMNTPLQGTAADIIKIAMIKVYEELKTKKMKSRLLLQVHDELLVEAHKTEIEEVKDIIKRNMESAATLLVPLVVDINIGDNWLEAH
ncbi:MAG TPA: DNA polymerase I [Clostridiales bacterium]|nr:MAG: DNA polymerase I [Clostridiales bacterium GWD2_32_19]HCC07488.1 DNA polymerase I [Clostridiales bacterium]